MNGGLSSFRAAWAFSRVLMKGVSRSIGTESELHCGGIGGEHRPRVGEKSRTFGRLSNQQVKGLFIYENPPKE